jgi:hypothetical protein
LPLLRAIIGLLSALALMGAVLGTAFEPLRPIRWLKRSHPAWAASKWATISTILMILPINGGSSSTALRS